jgi:hypothetical protein
MTQNENEAVAILDCPCCGQQNVVGKDCTITPRSLHFTSTEVRATTCKNCHKSFTPRDYDVYVSCKSAELLAMEFRSDTRFASIRMCVFTG